MIIEKFYSFNKTNLKYFSSIKNLAIIYIKLSKSKPCRPTGFKFSFIKSLKLNLLNANKSYIRYF